MLLNMMLVLVISRISSDAFRVFFLVSLEIQKIFRFINSMRLIRVYFIALLHEDRVSTNGCSF